LSINFTITNPLLTGLNTRYSIDIYEIIVILIYLQQIIREKCDIDKISSVGMIYSLFQLILFCVLNNF